MNNEFRTAAPAVGKVPMTIWTWVTNPLKGRYVDSAEMEITWLLELSARVSFCHGGKEVNEFSSFNDFYGYGTCLSGSSGAINEARRIAQSFSVFPESSAEVQVTCTAKFEPALPATSKDGHDDNEKADSDPRYKRVWTQPPVDLRLRRANKFFEANEPKETDPQWIYPALCSVLHREQVVWSSKTPDMPPSTFPQDALASAHVEFDQFIKGLTLPAE